MIRRLVILLLALLICVGEAEARDETYCVGGYSGDPPNATAVCNTRKITRAHKSWHFHVWFMNNGKCYACYDEVDNSCISDFMRRHPRFRPTDPWSCPKADTMDTIIEHRIAGKDVTKPPPAPKAPPKPEPVVLQSRMDTVSPGPYAAGDPIQVTASVRDGSGALRAVPGGTFVVTTAEGDTIRVPAKVRRDGTLAATVALPTSRSVSIRFEATPPKLEAHERFKGRSSSSRKLSVDTCGYRARLGSPADGGSLTWDLPASLGVAMFQADGRSPTSVPAGAALTITLTPDDADPVTLAVTDGTATWTPPERTGPYTVSVSVGGRANGKSVCPGNRVRLSVSGLGLGLDTSELPSTCYAQMACAGTARLVRPDGTASAKVDALLGHPDTQVALFDGPTEIWRGPPNPDDRYPFSASYPGVQEAEWRVEVHGPDGLVELPHHEVHIRPPLVLALPPEIDFGTVPAGTPWSETCHRLDFSGSTAAQEHTWRIERTGSDDCQAVAVLGMRSPTGAADRRGLSPALDIEALDPDAPWLDICLEVPRCAGDEAPADAALRIHPLTKEFAGQQASVVLRWTVSERSLWSCWAWLIVPVGGGLITLIVVMGFIRPHRFPAHAAIRIAGRADALKRASAMTLRGLPGSGAGWYRSAALGVHPSGEVNGTLRGAALVLRARRDGIAIEPRARFEIRDRRTRKWVGVEEATHLPIGGTAYRVGQVIMEIEV